MKCRWCGKEFEPKDSHHKYCQPQCKTDEYNTEIKAKRHFKRIAKENGFEVDLSKISKITNAKLMMFKKDYLRCPCDAMDNFRYCGSPKCLGEITAKGQCHCGLFKEKENE